jgi:ATP/maltotriose-dependent transcriptional regulator MalT
VNLAQSFRARLGELRLCASRRLTRAAQRGFQQADDLLLAEWCRVWIASDSLLLGDYAEALELARRGEPGEESASTLVAAVGRLTLASALADAGRLAEARVEAEALIGGESGPHRNTCFHGLGRSLLAEILRRSGDLAAAEDHARCGAALLSGFPAHEGLAAARLSAVRLARGDVGGALSLAREAHDRLSSTYTHGDITIRLAFARALAVAGERAAAISAIRAARADLLQRASRLDEPAARATFLERVPDNARVLSLARAWSEQGC